MTVVRLTAAVQSCTSSLPNSDCAVVQLLLSKLCSLLLSDLAHKSKTRHNPPPKGRKRGKASVAADPKSVTPADRIRVYPNEHFTVSNKKLFRCACREELAMTKSVIELHVNLRSIKINGEEGFVPE